MTHPEPSDGGVFMAFSDGISFVSLFASLNLLLNTPLPADCRPGRSSRSVNFFML